MSASISGSITWQAIAGGSETPAPLIAIYPPGDPQGGRGVDAVAWQTSTDGSYSFSGLPAGSYVVKVTDQANGGAPLSYYPVTFYGDKYSYEDATVITLTDGQVSSGNVIHMLVGGTVVGKITGTDGANLPWIEGEMESATGADANMNSSRNDDGTFGWSHLDEAKNAGSDGAGNVLIRGIAPDEYAFRYAGDDTAGPDGTAYAPNYWNSKTFRRDATLLTVQLGATYTVNQALSAGAYVNGTIKDAAGTWIQGGFAVLYNTEETTDDNAGIVNVGQIFGGDWSFGRVGPGTYRVGFTQAANGVTSSGSLASSYPFVSSWYGGSSYATATKIVVAAGHSATNINGVMPYDESFLHTWVAEQSGGHNASEPYCQCFSGDPINDATGEFFLDALPDLSLPGAGPAVLVQRNYSSTTAPTDGPFGYGWSAGLSSRLDIITASPSGPPQVVQVTQENGATVRFSLDVNGVYEAPPRVLASLTLLSSGAWAFTRRAIATFNFDSTGVLQSIVDLHGNAVSYGYSGGRVATISGAGGRQLTLSWTGSRITALTDSAARTVSYGYDGAGELNSVTDVNGGISRYTYDSGHQMLTAVNPNGGITTNTYDTSGRVIKQTDPLGLATTWAYAGTTADETTTVTAPDAAVHSEHYLNLILASTTAAVGTSKPATTSYQYNEALEVVTKTDALKRATTYTWDSDGNKLTQTTPLLHTTTWYYDGLNDLTGTNDPDSHFSSNSYDSTGNLLSSTSAAYNKTSFTYNANGTVATRKTPNGAIYHYGYNAAGQRTSVTDPGGGVTSTAYNPAGFVTSTTDALTHTTSFAVNGAGQVLTATDPLGNVSNATYDADGNRTSMLDAEGHHSSATYDLADNLASTTDNNAHTTSYAYGSNGLISSVTDANGGATSYVYNAFEQKIQSVNPIGRKTTYKYDLDGRQTTVVTPTGATTTTLYNADSKATKVIDPLGKVTTFAFDADGRLTSVTDPLARVTTTTYTADGKVSNITQPDGSSKTWAYDRDDNITSFTNADALVTTYAYDSVDRQVSQVEPGGLTTQTGYDAAGRRTTTTRPDGGTITMAYDADNRLTSTTPSGTGAVASTFQYGLNGERTRMTDASGITTYTYDAAGQVTGVNNGAGQQVSYAYDNVGHLLKLTYPTGKAVTYVYDKAGEMTSLKDWNAKTTTFTWTADALQANQVGADGVTEKRGYNRSDALTSVTDSTKTGALATYGYTYDAAGQLTSDTTTDPILTATNHTYTYDAVGQLASATQGTTATLYTATPGGELTASATSTAATYNAAQQVTGSTTSTGATAAYSYGGNGQRTGASITANGITTAASYNYDPYGNLAGATVPIGASVAYISDADGLRQSTTTGTTVSPLIWDTQAHVPLLLDDGTNSYIYGSSSTPIAQIADSGGAVQYLHGDLVGSVRMITDPTGKAIGTTEYSPFGSRTSHTGTADCALGYTGALTDLITGLIYLRARIYDAGTGSFLTVDPAINATQQPYAYASNDPLTVVDPLGLTGGSVGTIAGWIAVAAGLGGLALDATGFGAPLGLILEVVSLGAGAIAIADDCAGVFGGDVDPLVCGLDIAGEATAGIAQVSAAGARTAAEAAKAAASTGVKEYTAAVKAASAAALDRSAAYLAASSLAFGVGSLDSYYGQQLVHSTGGSHASASLVRC